MNPKQPLFSVVIPVYNKEAFIAETLQSVLSQRYGNFEVVLVNDGSTDRSLEVLQGFRDDRLTIYTKKNGGVSAARNYGIHQAQGKYIALLDADDSWEPDFLQEMQAMISKYPECGLYASAYKKLSPKAVVMHGETLPEGVVDDFFRIKLLHLVPCSSAVVIRKKVFEDVGGFPLGMIGGEDDYTWAKIALKYPLAVTPKVLAVFNEAGSAIAHRMGKLDSCKESWFDFYEEGQYYRNEFVAKKAIYAGIRYAYNTSQVRSLEIERRTQYTELSKKRWRDLYLLNRTPLMGLLLLQALTPHYKRAKRWVSTVKKTTLKSFFQLWF